MKKEFILETDKDTKNAGKKIGELISSNFCIFLYGNLGSGKTTFAQGLAKGLGISKEYYVTSPTYSIINEYPGRLKLYHIDLYRIEEVLELDYIGIDEIMNEEDAVIAVEWPEILNKNSSYPCDLKIEFSLHEKIERKISIFASGRNGSNLLEKLLL
ncbi:MAG: tRNA (adenosine(37)-N6)-threonylcarbamoyltransferase complex ATPase subunit type 1 TsaE [Desulfobacteraceae bacterium]|nr:tRNA (adenosine(37)-N6)-threonylcarbamoyltransferase complex ATPase subunit type 1 TsaE [Desulfobacteraceae bacterium]